MNTDTRDRAVIWLIDYSSFTFLCRTKDDVIVKTNQKIIWTSLSDGKKDTQIIRILTISRWFYVPEDFLESYFNNGT